MAGPRRGLAAAAALACAVAVATSPASALRALHVDKLSMRADRAGVRIGDVFHLAIHVHVREKVQALDELVIPDVGTMQLEGDERHVTASSSGTDVVETLTLEPTQAGAFTFAPAYLDAIDARTGKPSRFSSNPVRVVVTASGAPAVPLAAIGTVVAVVAGTLTTLLCMVAAVFVLFAVARRRRRVAVAPGAPAAATPPPVPPPAPPTPRDAVRDALRTYRVAPSTAAVMTLRARLFEAAGVPAGATLRDARAATPDPALRAALDAAERTAFGPAYARDASSAELIGATEAWLR